MGHLALKGWNQRMSETMLSEAAMATVRCFPPRGYGYRMEYHIEYELKTMTDNPSPALTELGEARLISRFYVPQNCGPGYFGYRLTSKGRTLRQSM